MKDDSSFTISPEERSIRRRQVHESLKDKAYRDEFVRQQIERGLPFQIKGMRKARGWKQSEFGDRLGTPQSVVSRLENPDYGKFNIQTLLEIASTLDVALLVTFAPFSDLAKRVSEFSIGDVEIPEFDKDPGFQVSQTQGASNVLVLTTHGNKPVAEDTTADNDSSLPLTVQTSLALTHWQK